ncbi:MAG: transposase [Gammaproteobacteria bacterium]|nr:transposase [Gammaproteobacteria bacterium]
MFQGFSENGLVCPSCGSSDSDRIARGFFGKLFLRKRRFVCRKCRTKYFVGKGSISSPQNRSSDSLT